MVTTLCNKCGKEAATLLTQIRGGWRAGRGFVDPIIYKRLCDSCAKPIIELLEVRK